MMKSNSLTPLENLYYNLWLSADFDADFARDLKPIYTTLKQGKNITDAMLEISTNYLHEWQNRYKTVGNFKLINF